MAGVEDGIGPRSRQRVQPLINISYNRSEAKTQDNMHQLEFSSAWLYLGSCDSKLHLVEQPMHIVGPEQCKHEKWQVFISRVAENEDKKKLTLFFRANRFHAASELSLIKASIQVDVVKFNDASNIICPNQWLTFDYNDLLESVKASASYKVECTKKSLNIPTKGVWKAHFKINFKLSQHTSRVQPPGPFGLYDDMKKLFDDQEFGDIVFHVGEKKFLAYKGIVCQRSPVLKAAFTTDMEENKLGVFKITDTDPDVIEEMLVFLYTNEAPKLADMAFPLLVAAEKYQIDGLKVLCEEKLSGTINRRNCMDLLLFAEQQGTAYLKYKVFSFMSQNIGSLKNDKKFKSSMIQYPELNFELLQMLSNLYINSLNIPLKTTKSDGTHNTSTCNFCNTSSHRSVFNYPFVSQ